MIISMIQPVRSFPLNGILSLQTQLNSRRKVVPQLTRQEQHLFSQIERSSQKMTKQDLISLMGINQ